MLTKINYEDEDTANATIDEANLTVTELKNIEEDSESIDEGEDKSESDSDEHSNTNDFNMTDPRVKFVQLCASTLNQKFDGDPLSLDIFINGIELLELLAGDNGDLLVSFIKTRLCGKALEAIPKEGATIANIKSTLRATIKPDSSKVVEGKILALRFNPTKSSEFTSEDTLLAEALQRSLIIEGIPQAKAKEMAVEKTIEVCRKNSRSNTVKAILASKVFSEPSEVIAKMIVEGNNDYQEKQILSFQKQPAMKY